MTQAPTPGPLSRDDVKLLVKGDLVGCGQIVGTLKGFADGWGCATVIAPNGAEFSRILHKGFTFIGRPDESGWMPWSGGENPVPGQRVQWRTRNETDRVMSVLSNNLDWTHECRRGFDPIIAFRLVPTAPVEASGSERDRIARLAWTFRGNDRLGGPFYDGAKPTDSPAMGDAFAFADAVIDALRPQPSGETRARIMKEVLDAVFSGFEHGECEKEWEPEYGKEIASLATDAILALLSARPLALGGQQGEAVTIIRDRLRQIWEGDTHLVYSGNPPEPSHDEEGDLAKLANEAVEALNSLFPVPDALSTTPARAEAQDEGAAAFVPGNVWKCEGEGEDGEDVWQSEVQTMGGHGLVATVWGGSEEEAAQRRDAVFAVLSHPSPTPAADADRVREAIIQAVSKGLDNEWKDWEITDAILAALKSEGK